MASRKSISRLLLFNMSLAATVSIAALGYLWISHEYSQFSKDAQRAQRDMMEARKALIKTQVDEAVDYIEYKRSQTDRRVREMLQQRAGEAHALATHVYEQYKDAKSLDEIKDLVREALRPLRFNNGRGYYFAMSMDGVEWLFPDHPELEEQSLLDMRDSEGAFVVRDMIALVKAQGEGFYSYTWTKPNTPGAGFRKISFVKRFAPFDCFFGAGEYADDMEQQIKEEALQRLERMRFGDDGYIFVSQWDGLTLLGPAKGQNMTAITDPNGVKIVQELISLAKGDGGFLEYVMPNLEGRRPDPKLSYVRGVKDWQWYVGTGVYIGDIDKALAREKEEMVAAVKKNVAHILVLLAAILLAALWLAKRTANRMRRAFDAFVSFFQRAASESVELSGAGLGFAEFERLAAHANQMLAQRRSAREALKQSEERYRGLFDMMLDGFILQEAIRDGGPGLGGGTGLDGGPGLGGRPGLVDLRILALNPACERMTGLSAGQTVGKTVKEVLPSVSPRWLEACDKVALTGEPVHFEHYSRGFDRHIEVTLFRPAPEQVAAIFTDITESKRAEQDRAKLEEELRHAHKMEAVGLLAGGVAHDFNNLLQVIHGYTQLALDDLPTDAPGRPFLKEVMTAANRAIGLVRQLLAFSRRQALETKRLDLSVVISDLMTMVRRVIGEHIELDVRAQEGLRLVRADPGQIEQIIVNLCLNARDAMGEGGKIVIETSNVAFNGDFCQSHPWAREGEFVVVAVADTGCGIAPENRERIFEPFFTTKEVGKGTGLGLATVYGIVKQHDGLIEVSSEPNKGTVFRVYFPAAAE